MLELYWIDRLTISVYANRTVCWWWIDLVMPMFFPLDSFSDERLNVIRGQGSWIKCLL